MKIILLVISLSYLVACGQGEYEDAIPNNVMQEKVGINLEAAEKTRANLLAGILEAQNDEAKDRFQYRHPGETLDFMGIQPGMTVVEALPGGGWYSKILAPYLSKEGQLIGVDYSIDMWPHFDFGTPEFIEKRKKWADEWPTEAKAWAGDEGAAVSAFTFGSLPYTLNNSVDAVLFVRSLHNIARFEEDGGFFSAALQGTYRVLKKDGVVGVVQHAANEDKSDEWANGSNGYLKKSAVITQFENAGFKLLKESSLNENPKDQPGEEDIVWRLPPSYATSQDNEILKSEYAAIGESNRMTLLFRKK
ncbi:MAG: putative methyltransferase [Lentisphaeria bacterium]|jgi:predicted methyltransferase